MNRDDVIRMAVQCQLVTTANREGIFMDALDQFAQLVAAAKDAEHKEAMRWDVHTCGPTCKRYACVMTREAVAAEREECAKVCDAGVDTEHPIVKGHIMKGFGKSTLLADAIRARGQQ